MSLTHSRVHGAMDFGGLGRKWRNTTRGTVTWAPQAVEELHVRKGVSLIRRITDGAATLNIAPRGR